MIFPFGQSQHKRIESDALHCEREPVGEHVDDNWLTVLIFVQAGGVNGKIRAAILTDELTTLFKQLLVYMQHWLTPRNSPRCRSSYICSLQEMAMGA